MTINSIYIIYIEIILCILLYIFKCIYAYTWNYKLVLYYCISLSFSLSLSPNIGYYQFFNFGQVCLIHPYIQSYFSIQNISYFKLKKFAPKSFSMVTKGQILRLDCLGHVYCLAQISLTIKNHFIASSNS